MWTLQALYPNNDTLVIGVAAVSTQPLNFEHLQKAVKHLVVRHRSLRTRFPCQANGKPYQEVLALNTLEFSKLIDSAIITINCSESNNCPISFEEDGVHFNYDLNSGPLWRFILFTNVTCSGFDEPSSVLTIYANSPHNN